MIETPEVGGLQHRAAASGGPEPLLPAQAALRARVGEAVEQKDRLASVAAVTSLHGLAPEEVSSDVVELPARPRGDRFRDALAALPHRGQAIAIAASL